MGDKSKIEWTEATWNPIVGCSVVSPGCTNCYAMRQAHRLASNPATPHYAGTTKIVNGKPVWTGKVAPASDRVITQPLRWSRPRAIFINSMGDLFHESVPDEWIDRVFAVMALTPHHTYQVLTKRADRMRDYVRNCGVRLGRQHELRAAIEGLVPDSLDQARARLAVSGAGADWRPLPNVWLGVSAEDQRRADERVPLLLDTPAAVRFVSAEPLLGAMDLTRVPDNTGRYGPGPVAFNVLSVRHNNAPALNLVIAGGESGPGARPMHPDWARGLRDQCQAAGVPFFFKQWGEWVPVTFDALASEEIESEELAGRIRGFDDQPMHKIGKRTAGRLLDGRVHDALPTPQGSTS